MVAAFCGQCGRPKEHRKRKPFSPSGFYLDPVTQLPQYDPLFDSRKADGAYNIYRSCEYCPRPPILHPVGPWQDEDGTWRTRGGFVTSVQEGCRGLTLEERLGAPARPIPGSYPVNCMLARVSLGPDLYMERWGPPSTSINQNRGSQGSGKGRGPSAAPSTLSGSNSSHPARAASAAPSKSFAGSQISRRPQFSMKQIQGHHNTQTSSGGSSIHSAVRQLADGCVSNVADHLSSARVSNASKTSKKPTAPKTVRGSSAHSRVQTLPDSHVSSEDSRSSPVKGIYCSKSSVARWLNRTSTTRDSDTSQMSTSTVRPRQSKKTPGEVCPEGSISRADSRQSGSSRAGDSKASKVTTSTIRPQNSRNKRGEIHPDDSVSNVGVRRRRSPRAGSSNVTDFEDGTAVGRASTFEKSPPPMAERVAGFWIKEKDGRYSYAGPKPKSG